MRRFISRLYTPPQCDRAKKVQPISISLFAGSYAWKRDEPMTWPDWESMAIKAAAEIQGLLEK